MSPADSTLPPAPTAAVLLIGNELLSGKIRDENGHHIAQVARRRGIRLIEICTVPDEPTAIIAAILRLVAATNLVFTSGGVGPTHDDLTLASLAQAFDFELVTDPTLERLLRTHYGEATNDAVLQMAKIPAPARLVAQPGWPALRLDVNHAGRDARIYILPGVPSLFRSKMSALEAIAGELPQFNAWEVVTIDTERDESEFAADLRDVAELFPEVEIGSYPTWQPGTDGRLSVKVRLTFEAQQPGSARAAAQTFSERLTLRGTCDTAPH